MKEIRVCDNGDIELAKELCVRYNLGIEIQGLHDPYIENKEKIIEKYKEILPNIKRGKSFHAPFWDLNIGTKMKGLRQETMDIFNNAYKIAKELGCTEIVVHNGYIPGTYYSKGWVERAKDFWTDFFADKDNSIIMCIENQFEIDSEIMKLEIDEVNDKRLKICLDVGHANANSNMAVEEWITSLGNRIAYLHLHNNHGKQNIKGHNNDEHLMLNDGIIDMKKNLDLLEQHSPDAIWNLETKNEYLEGSIEYLKELGYIK